METFRLTLALLLPWLLGSVWLRMAWSPGSAGAWAAIIGYGYFFGTLATAVALLGLNALGLPQGFVPVAGILAAATGFGYWVNRRVSRFRSPPAAPLQPKRALRWTHVAAAFFVALVVLRLAGFALEVAWRPIYPWDAWMNWAPKARVWFDLGTLVPYVSPEEWISGASPESYSGSTHGNWAYPPLVPLAELWVARALGHWDESLINLPWLLCAAALLFAFYGQSRRLGASPLATVIFCYLLISMPIVGTHVALAGYADLWVAAFYALAAMAFLHWVRDGDLRQLAMAFVLILALPLVKRPGIAWAATFVPAFMVALLPRRVLLISGAAITAGLVLLYFTAGIEIAVPNLGEIVISPDRVKLPGYSGEGFTFYPVWEPFIENFFVLANWHLFWFLLPLLVPAIPMVSRDRLVATALSLALAGFGFLFFAFFFSKSLSEWAEDYTTLNRAVLHMVPALLFVILLVGLRLRDRFFSPSSRPAAASLTLHGTCGPFLQRSPGIRRSLADEVSSYSQRDQGR